MVASIGAVAAPAQCAAYFERDDYYAKDDPAHREASAWRGRGAEDLGLSGPVDPDILRAVLEGVVPDGSGRRLGRPGKDGAFQHRPGRDLTLSAPKSVSLLALLGGDARAIRAHEVAVARTLDWVERNVAETRMSDPGTGRMVQAGDQKSVIATFRHDTSRNLDPLLHTHAVIANMVRGTDGKWRTMSNEKLYAQKMLIGALYRTELARGLEWFGYRVEKTHADGRFEVAGVPRDVIEAFSTRRAEIEAAMSERGLGATAENQLAAQRVALMTRDRKREADKATLMAAWEKQAKEVGFDAAALKAQAMARSALSRDSGRSAADVEPAREAVEWAVAHLAEREAVFDRADLLAGALAWRPGAVSMAGAEREVARLEKTGVLHAADLPGAKDMITTEKAAAAERETIAQVKAGRGRGAPAMRGRAVDKALRNGPLTHGQREAVKLILTDPDRVVGVQGYAGTGKTRMLRRARALLEKRGYEVRGLAPSASAARTLEAEAGIGSETLQRFLTRYADVAQGRLKRKAQKQLRAGYGKTVLVVDEGSLASTREVRELLRISEVLRLPAGRARGRCETARRRRRRQTLRAIATSRHEDGGDERDHAPARPGLESGRRGHSRGRRQARLRETRLERGRGQARQPRGRRRRALDSALPRGARKCRTHGAEPRDSREDQRHRPRAADQGRRRTRSLLPHGATRLARLHQPREIARRELFTRRRRRLPPPLQAPGRRERG